ncbi:hypothetical protein ZWY2020_053323 [Hordeum vulgare]|nr:hypothetical protein ZWY2020_053323 [Hordeum vulgare]
MEFGDRTWARAPISLLLLPIADAATINLIFTTSGLTGLETPDVIDLRKVQRKEADDQAEMRLYKVDLLKNQRPERVDVTLHPEELEVMDDVLPAKYEQAREEERFGKQQDYFSDMVAENASKMERKLDKYWWSLQPKGGRVNKKKIVYVLLIQGPKVGIYCIKFHGLDGPRPIQPY